MSYGEVLASSWKTIWKFKVLWIFGILAALGSGGGGGGGGSPSYQSPGSDLFGPDFENQIGRWFEQNWWIFIVAAVLIFFLVVLIIILSTYGRIGLARGAWKVDEGAVHLTFGQLFAESGQYFWRVIGLALLIFVIAFGGIMIIAIGSMGVAIMTLGLGLLCLIPLFCVLGIVFWVFEIIVRLAVIAIVGEDAGVIQGLQRAWDTVRDHLGESVVMGLILGIGSWIIRLIIGLPFLLAMIPLVSLMFNQGPQVLQRALIGSGVLFCLYLPVAIFLGGIVESYVGTAWTLSFRRLTGHGRPAVEVA